MTLLHLEQVSYPDIVTMQDMMPRGSTCLDDRIVQLELYRMFVHTHKRYRLIRIPQCYQLWIHLHLFPTHIFQQNRLYLIQQDQS